MDFVRGSERVVQGGVMVHEVDQGSHELAHVRLDEIGPGVKHRREVRQVCSHHFVEMPLLVGFIEGLQAIGEQPEGTADEDAPGVHLLQLPGGVQHALAGGDDIVYDDDILAVDILAQEFVGHDGILAAYDGGIVPALIEHADIHPQDGGEIDCAIHGALVGADDNQMFLVHDQIVL